MSKNSEKTESKKRELNACDLESPGMLKEDA